MGFKINTEIKPLNETDIKLMTQTELETSLQRLNQALREQHISRGLDADEATPANNNITPEIIAKMNAASALI